MKRTVSVEFPFQATTYTTHHEAATQQSQYFATAPPPIKFVSAATMALSMNSSGNPIQEISDEELLQIALMLEKEQEQQ